MKKIILVLIFLINIHSDIFSQLDYSVSLDDRNKAIELTNNALKNIEDKSGNEAFNNLLKAVTIDSTYRKAYLQIYQAWKLYAQNSEIAIQTLNKGKQIYKEDDELHFYCGEIYRSNSDYTNAFIEYNYAITFAKKNGEDFYLVPYYYLNRGNCFLKIKQLENAIKDYDYLLNLKPDFVSALTNRGITLYKLGKKEQACSDWNKAIENNYDPAKKYYNKYCIK